MIERFLEPEVADPDCCCPLCGKDSLYADKSGWVCYKCDERIELPEPCDGEEYDH